MRAFMSNPCGYPNCKIEKCYNCRMFRPKFLGKRVPKIIGKWLYNLETRLCYSKNSKF